MAYFGIDISEWNGDINLTLAKAQGVTFAMLRAGFTGYGASRSKNKDAKFETFYKECKSLGISVGAYWYSCATTYEEGETEANYMIANCLTGKVFEYPICIDVEDTHHQKPAGAVAVTAAIKGFCDTLEAAGFYAMVYANLDFFENHIQTYKIPQYDKWVASWGKFCPDWPEANIWQFGGETNLIRSNKIGGVVCDQNYSYIDFGRVMERNGLNGYKLPASGRPSPAVYRVKKGDTLSSIAAQYKTTWQEIYKLNRAKIGDDPNFILPGMFLVVGM